MPIIGRTPTECYGTFREHLGPLVASVITDEPLLCVRMTKEDSKRTLEFANSPVPLETRLGRVYFHMAQQLVAEPEPKSGRYRLRTQQYWYRLQQTPHLDAQALVRWEYDQAIARDGPARHHVQIAASTRLDNGQVFDLNKLHTPTGYTTIEEVARFLIYDLGLQPPCGIDAWAELLHASERAFFEDFTGKRYKPDDI